MGDISRNGYVLLKNCLSPDQLQYGLSSDHKGILDYKIMRNFIDGHFFPAIVSNSQIFKRPTYLKFRYSNNNNSTDASTFHSDVYNFTDSEIMPIYTCLCYFDKTQMELIPGSHLKSFRDSHTSVGSFFQKKTITIEPGDILIFHANLHHRGVNFDKQGDRRLLQVFECFTDEEAYQEYHEKLITVLSSKSFIMEISNMVMYLISKIPPLIDTINFFHYIMVYNDLQYKVALNDLPPWEKSGKMISYEPGKRIDFTSITGADPINTNIVVGDTHPVKPSAFYVLFYMLYWIASLLILYYLGKWLTKSKMFKSLPKGKKVNSSLFKIRSHH